MENNKIRLKAVYEALYQTTKEFIEAVKKDDTTSDDFLVKIVTQI